MRRLIIVSLLLLSNLFVNGTEYFVRTSGSDSNSGLSDAEAWAHHPWMSTWTGRVVLKPGDIVNMRRGDTWSIANPVAAFLNVDQSGSPGMPIITTAYGTGSKPLIKITTESNVPVVYAAGKSYLTFDNLHIQHHSGNYAIDRDGFKLVQVCHHLVFTNNEIDNIPSIAIWGRGDCYNIVVGDTTAKEIATATAYSNHIHNFGYAGVGLVGVNPENYESHFFVCYNYIHDATRTQAGDMEYGIYFSASESSSAWPKYAYAKYNRVENIKTWECLDMHGGSHIYFQDNYLRNFGKFGIMAGGSDNYGLPNLFDHIYIERNIIEQTPGGWIEGDEGSFITAYQSSDGQWGKDIYISNNKLFYTSAPQTSHFIGISLRNLDGVVIQGNRLLNGSKEVPGDECIALPFTGLLGVKNLVAEKNFIYSWGSGIVMNGGLVTGKVRILNNIILSPSYSYGGIRIRSSDLPSSADLEILNNTLISEPGGYGIRSTQGLSSGGRVQITNNIIGFTNPGTNYISWTGNISGSFSCNYNSYWNTADTKPFNILGTDLGWTEWKARGFDSNSLYDENPGFLNASGQYTQDVDFNIIKESPVINRGYTLGLLTDYASNPISGVPDIGAFEYQSIQAPSPVLLNSVIENATPSKLDLTFNLPLANIVPASSSFSVRVNSNSISVGSVAVSGTKVSLTLSAAVAYGDIVTVAYTKPSVNPLQTSEGGQVAFFSAQTVSNKVAAPAPTPAAPVYVSSSVENATPSKLDIIFNLLLANIIPAVSAFTVAVNSGTRSVSSVVISGTKVTLTLSTQIAFGDVVTVAYNKPSANPLQTSEGGQAPSFAAKTITNNISTPPAPPAIPVYVSSSVENASPAKIDISFNLALASVVPSSSAFTVIVNSASRTVSSVAVAGTKVTLTLSNPIAFGNVITVAYTKPASNPLQTSAGGQVASFTAQPVSNKVAAVNNNPVPVVNSPESSFSGFVYELNATGSYDADNDILTYSWTAPANVPVSSTTGPIVKFLGPIVTSPASVEFTLKISDGKATVSKTVPVEILPYKPELEAAEIVNVEASSYYSQNYPYNIVDGNIGTMWSADGTDQWLIIELKESFNVQHVKLAFQSGQKSESYFDILGSVDKVSWEPILDKTASCGFSGDLQVFDFPPSKAEKEYRYVKITGLGNLTDDWNYISELKIYGYRHKNPTSYENLAVKLYPNPAAELINIRIDNPGLSFDFIKIIDLTGGIVFQNILDKDLREFQIPLDIHKGIYLVQMGSGNLTLYTSKLIISSR